MERDLGQFTKEIGGEELDTVGGCASCVSKRPNLIWVIRFYRVHSLKQDKSKDPQFSFLVGVHNLNPCLDSE